MWCHLAPPKGGGNKGREAVLTGLRTRLASALGGDSRAASWFESRFAEPVPPFTPGFLVQDIVADRNSSIFVVWAAPGSRDAFPKGRGRSPRLFWRVLFVVRTQAIYDFRSVKATSNTHPDVNGPGKHKLQVFIEDARSSTTPSDIMRRRGNPYRLAFRRPALCAASWGAPPPLHPPGRLGFWGCRPGVL